METSPFELRCRRAVRHALWFSAAFTIACAFLTLIGPEKDASITGLLTVIGALLFAASLGAKRVFLP